MKLSPLFYLGALLGSAQAYWMEEVQHQGIVPGNPDSSYQIFRNVKDFGAVGDGGKLGCNPIGFAQDMDGCG